MAIAFGAYTTGQSASSNSLTFTGPNVTGTEKVGILGISSGPNTTNITGVTWNGDAMTFIAEITSGDGIIELWYIINPDDGANNIIVSAAASADFIIGRAAFYTGASQTSQPDASATDTQASASAFPVNLTTSASDCWLVVIARNDTASYSETVTGGVNRSGVANSAYFDSNGAVSSGANSITINTQGGGAANHIGVIASIAPVAAGPANLKSYNTNVKANIKTINTNPIANVKTLNTNA